jgi:hypothetical protein
MGFMLPMMGMSLLSNLLGRKDGGSIPPSNAKARMGAMRPAAKKKGGAVPKKRGGAVKKRKSKPKK